MNFDARNDKATTEVVITSPIESNADAFNALDSIFFPKLPLNMARK